MSLQSRVRRLARLVSTERISEEELKIREGYFHGWSIEDLRAVAYCPVGESFPEHIETRLRKDGLIQ